ncbi:hypothetical protein AAY473_040000 [Plecturocebus cupreus]
MATVILRLPSHIPVCGALGLHHSLDGHPWGLWLVGVGGDSHTFGLAGVSRGHALFCRQSESSHLETSLWEPWHRVQDDRLPTAQAAWTGAMSSPDEVPFLGAHYDMEGGEQAGALTVSPRAPRGHSPEGEGQSEGEGGFADPEDINLELHSELIEQGRVVLWGREALPVTPVDHQGDGVDYSSYLAEEQAAIVPPTSVQGHRSPEGAADNWTGLQVGPSKSGALGPGPGARHVASAGPLQVTGPGAGPAWQHRQSGSKIRWRVSVDPRQPSAKGPAVLSREDSDSADQSCDLRPMRVGIGLNEGSQAKPQSPEKTAGTRRHCQQSFSPAPGPFLTSAPFRLPPLVERPAVGELENSPWEKMQSRAQGEVEVRPSCSGAVAAGALPQDPWRRKMAQEKSLGGASLLTLGRAVPSLKERLSATPQEPNIFPPLSDVQPQGMSKKPQKPKHSSPTRKTTRRRTRESQAAARQNNSDRDDDPGAQPPAQRPGLSCPSMPRGELSSGDPNIRPPQVPRTSEPSAYSLGGLLPRRRARSGDHISWV